MAGLEEAVVIGYGNQQQWQRPWQPTGQWWQNTGKGKGDKGGGKGKPGKGHDHAAALEEKKRLLKQVQSEYDILKNGKPSGDGDNDGCQVCQQSCVGSRRDFDPCMPEGEIASEKYSRQSKRLVIGPRRLTPGLW